MTQITLTPDQNAVLSHASEPVAVCRPDGSIVGFVSPTISVTTPKECPFTSEEIAAAEKDAAGPGPFHTTKEVLDGLQRLHRA
jgi:hypothetical protein